MAPARSQARPVAASPAPGPKRRRPETGSWRRPGGWVEAGAVVGLLALLLVLVPAGLRRQDARAAVPAGFSDTLVTAIGVPTAIAFTPTGKMLVTTQGGVLKVVQGFQTPGGAVSVVDALNISGRICPDFERGLLGVAVDPGFAGNGYVYLFYTFRKHGTCVDNSPSSPVNRVSRFTMSGNSVSQASEVVLIDNMPSPNGNHNAGDLNFGPDGLLYVSIGDGGCDYAGNSGCGGANDAARDPHVLTGKILRITSGGGIPGGNPYASTGDRCNVTGRATAAGRRCQETFASGLRNPFRFAFDPNGSRFYINDVGQGAQEEIDRGTAGADYGWNRCEGTQPNGGGGTCAGFTAPIYAYGRGAGCGSITGGAFVPVGVWPAAYDGSYLFADYVCGKIFRLDAGGGGSDFASGLGNSSAVHLEFGPYAGSQALYYTTYAGGGQIRRIHFTGQANRPPVARATASPTFGALPLTVRFDGRGSSDPDGNPLTFSWIFGDNTPAGSGAQVSHTFTTRGTYTVTLTVRDNRGGTDTHTLRIDAGNTAPAPVITAPTTSDRYAVGQRITLVGRASDAEDGTLPPSALTWQVLIHHGTHTHPYLPSTAGNRIPFTAPPPEDLAATTNSYLEIRLTATDRTGLRRTISQIFRPRTVLVSFRSSPSGRTLEVNGTHLTAPRQITSWQGYVLNVNAPVQPDATGRIVHCTGWSDGGACAHRITTPATAAAYTAGFGPATVPNSAPGADAYVQEANPTANVGRGWTLRAEGGADPDVVSYLRFDVSGVGGVGRATLWLYAADGAADGPAVYGVSNAWDERAITWNSRPRRTTGVLADLGNVPAGTWVAHDVTGYVTGNGRYSFALVSSSTDPVAFHSRDYRANWPRLVVEPDTRPPTAPRGLVATVPAGQTNRIDLGWRAATDNAGVTGYEIERNGTIIATVGVATTYRDTGVAPLTTYTYRVRARDASGNRSAWSNHYRVTVPGVARGAFVAAADSRVAEARPVSNYGAWSGLASDGGAGPDVESYLRFTVGGIAEPIRSARLRVYVAEGTANGPAVYTAGNGWSETGITWTNRPARSATGRDDKGALTTGTWIEFDVTPWVTANGTYTFVLATTSADEVLFGSRESSNKPQLIINGAAAAAGLSAAAVAPAASPTASPAASPTATPATPTATPAPAAPTATPAAWQPFADGFETGDLAAWTETTGLAVEPDPTRGGSLTARARRSGAESGPAATGTFARRVLAPAQAELYVRVAVDRAAAGAAPVALLQLRNEAGAVVLTVALAGDGALLLQDAAGNQATSWVKITERGWHDLQVRTRIDPAGGPGLVDVWFDGRLVHRAPAVLGTAHLAELVLGDAAFVPGRAYDLAFDDVAVDVRCLGSCPGELVTPTPAPTATPTVPPEPTPTNTPEPAPSPTGTPEPPTPVPTDTPVPVPTETPAPPPTETPVPPPTDTPSPPPPTDTPVAPPAEPPPRPEGEGA